MTLLGFRYQISTESVEFVATCMMLRSFSFNFFWRYNKLTRRHRLGRAGWRPIETEQGIGLREQWTRFNWSQNRQRSPTLSWPVSKACSKSLVPAKVPYTLLDQQNASGVIIQSLEQDVGAAAGAHGKMLSRERNLPQNGKSALTEFLVQDLGAFRFK